MALALLKLLAILLTVGLLLVGFVILSMAKRLLGPDRMIEGRAWWILHRLAPGDIGLPFEEISFTVHDQANLPQGRLDLPAWWIPANANSGKCILILHGYSDSKIGGIAWAPTFRELGWNVLAIDLRAHGGSTGLHCTGGFFERHDISQVIDEIKNRYPHHARKLVIFGVSLGAGVAVATADLRQGKDIDALILESPYSSFADAARTHANSLGLPGPMFQWGAIKLAQRISGADFDVISPIRLVPTLPCPLMIIHAADDILVTRADMDRLKQAAASRPAELGLTEYWRCENTHHVLALRNNPEEFTRRIDQFLSKALEPTATKDLVPSATS